MILIQILAQSTLEFISSSPQCNLIFDFWGLFSLISFLKNVSRMKRSWREELQLPVTTKRSFLSRVAINEKTCSSDIGNFDSFGSKFFAKVISCFKSFSLNVCLANTKWIWFAKYFSRRNVWPPGHRHRWRNRRRMGLAHSLLSFEFCF